LSPYSFQGQEHDDEVKGDGNSVNYKYRMHDPRLGRFFAVDPLASHYSYNSPYAFSENVLINCIELEGLEKINHLVYTKKEKKWVIKWTETDNNLKENVNAYHRFNNQGQNYQTVVKPWVKGSGHKESVDYDGNIKSGSDNRHNMYLLFKSTAEAKMTESERDQMAAVNNSVSKDATHYDSWEGGDDGANTGNNAAGEQAPAAVKVIVGLIPIMSVYNAVTVLSTDKDMYGEEASSGWDKTMAIVSIFSVFGGVTKCATVAKASEKTINNSKKVDKVLEATSIADDAGAFDSE
jgi:RHS repeat-associated protein